jgi:ketosteroid isomerase-like protein
MSDTIDSIIAKEAIRDLIHTYCRAIDRCDIALLRSLAYPDARFEYGIFSGSAADFAEFAAQFLQNTGPTHHNVTNMLIEVIGDSAQAESYCIAMHGDVAGENGLIDLVAYVRYLDHFENREGRWRISRRTVVYDWNQNLPRTARWEGALHGGYLPRGGRDRSDESYRLTPTIGSTL